MKVTVNGLVHPGWLQAVREEKPCGACRWMRVAAGDEYRGLCSHPATVEYWGAVTPVVQARNGRGHSNGSPCLNQSLWEER